MYQWSPPVPNLSNQATRGSMGWVGRARAGEGGRLTAGYWSTLGTPGAISQGSMYGGPSETPPGRFFW